MGTREMCNVCGEFFIIGQEYDECPHGQIIDDNIIEQGLTYNDISEVGAIWKQKHDKGEITDNEYDAVAEAFGMLYKKLR